MKTTISQFLVLFCLALLFIFSCDGTNSQQAKESATRPNPTNEPATQDTSKRKNQVVENIETPRIPIGTVKPTIPRNNDVTNNNDSLIITRSEESSDPSQQWSDLFNGDMSFVEGMVAYNIKDSMKLNMRNKVSLSIGDFTDIEILKTKILTHSNTKDTTNIQTATINIGRKMRVYLKDPMQKIDPNFLIEEVSDAEQIVDLVHSKTVDWIWNVTPLKKGAHDLDLTIKMLVKNDLGESYKLVPVHSDVVTVYTDQISDDQIEVLSFVDEKKKTANYNTYIYILLGIIITLITALIVKKKVIQKKPRLNPKEISEFESLITTNTISALRKILDKIPNAGRKYRNSVLQLIANYEDNEKNFAENLISDDDYSINNSKVVKGALNLLGNFKA